MFLGLLITFDRPSCWDRPMRSLETIKTDMKMLTFLKLPDSNTMGTLAWVRVLVKMVSVAQKLSTIKCLSWGQVFMRIVLVARNQVQQKTGVTTKIEWFRGIIETKITSHKTVLVSSPSKNVICTLEINDCRS